MCPGLGGAIQPVAAGLSHGSKASRTSWLVIGTQNHRATRFVNLFGYAVTLGLIVIRAPLPPLLLGPAYDGATRVIIILALTTPLPAVGATLLLLTH